MTSALLGTIGFAAGYVASPILGVPRFFYDPLSRVISFGATAPAPAMGFYGLVLWGLAGGAVGGVLGRWIPASADRALAILALASVAADLCWFAANPR